jgi:hypothetical protein
MVDDACCCCPPSRVLPIIFFLSRPSAWHLVHGRAVGDALQLFVLLYFQRYSVSRQILRRESISTDGAPVVPYEGMLFSHTGVFIR